MLEYSVSSTDWKFIKILGSGAFGEVSLWNNLNNGESVAIKRCSLDPDTLGLDEKPKLKERWKHESEWVNEMQMENIVCGSAHLCPDLIAELNRHTKLPVIVMEYCQGGNLRTKLQQIGNANGLCEYEVRQVLGSLGKAIFYLHQHKITHRDIKPDNIVIKYVDGKSIYKLTDMGYARVLDHHTIIGSMVGSRNYFAPEMIISAEYKNSVDYWSMAIVAFEIICGVFPFLTDQSMFDGLTSIMQKPKGCIAISKSPSGELIQHTRLFPENRLCPPFRELIESWLQLSLEQDGRKRGYEPPDPQLQFYSKLERALEPKIVTVCWLNKCQLLSYVVDNHKMMDSLFKAIASDTGLNIARLYFVLPASHTLKSLKTNMTTIQLYDEQLAAENKSMLYLVDFEQNDLCNPQDAYIPEGVHLLLNQEMNSSPIMKRCALHALYFHHNILNRITEYINGINELGMNLEDEIMEFKKNVKEFHEKIVQYNGQAIQYERMVAVGKQLLLEKQIKTDESSENEWEVIAHNLKNLFAEYLEICSQLEWTLQQVRQFIKNSPFSTYLEPVALQVQKFEAFFEKIGDTPRSVNISDIQKQSVKYISNMLKVQSEFFQKSEKWLQNQGNRSNNSSNNLSSSSSILDVYIQFRTIMKVVMKNHSLRSICETRMTEKTKEYMETFGRQFYSQGLSEQIVQDLAETMQTMDMVPNIDESLDMPTDAIITQSQNLMEQLGSLHIQWN